MSKMEQGFFYSEKVEMGKKKLKKKILELACFSPKLAKMLLKDLKAINMKPYMSFCSKSMHTIT